MFNVCGELFWNDDSCSYEYTKTFYACNRIDFDRLPNFAITVYQVNIHSSSTKVLNTVK